MLVISIVFDYFEVTLVHLEVLKLQSIQLLLSLLLFVENGSTLVIVFLAVISGGFRRLINLMNMFLVVHACLLLVEVVLAGSSLQLIIDFVAELAGLLGLNGVDILEFSLSIPVLIEERVVRLELLCDFTD